MTNLFEHVSVGDKFISKGGVYGDSVAVVERLTATQVVTTAGRFNRKTGRPIGGGPWSRQWLTTLTPFDEDAAKAIRARNARRRIISHAKELSDVDALRVLEFMDQFIPLDRRRKAGR